MKNREETIYNGAGVVVVLIVFVLGCVVGAVRMKREEANKYKEVDKEEVLNWVK